jgi:hypothetical protein
MAGLDYAGLLTGISPQSAKIDPFSLPTAGQQRMALVLNRLKVYSELVKACLIYNHKTQ